jgi:glycosyltransferase involved in cell wall biosynthesis
VVRPSRRIALVCDWYHPRRGGIEAHLDGLATRLVARGHVVHVITSTPGPTDVNGIPVHRLDLPRLPFAEVVFAPVAWPIQQLLAREKIDIVHSHVSIISPVALAGGLAAHRAGLPSVVTFHSFVPGTPILARLAGALLGAHSWNAMMTAVSRRVIREVEPFAPDAVFSVLPNAIDTAFWTPLDAGDSHETVRLVVAGRLQSKKRPLLLLRVLRELKRTAAGEAWSLTIVGEGPLAGPLRDGVRDLGLDDRVRFAGWLDRDRLRDTLRSSDIFLSTAARESFGLAALEARACGLPVVAVEDSAVSAFITHEVSGLLASTDDGFASATARLVLDSALRNRLRDFNRRTTVPLDWTSALDAHEALYAKAEAMIRR